MTAPSGGAPSAAELTNGMAGLSMGGADVWGAAAPVSQVCGGLLCDDRETRADCLMMLARSAISQVNLQRRELRLSRLLIPLNLPRNPRSHMRLLVRITTFRRRMFGEAEVQRTQMATVQMPAE